MSDEKKLSDDLNDMLDDAKDGIKKTAGRVSRKVEELKGDAKEAFDDAKEKTAEFADEAKEKAGEFAGEAKDAYEKVTGENKKVLAGVTAILLGGFGVHKFILGYNKEGTILLIATIVISILSFGFLVWVFTLIEGVIYLTKTNNEFHKIYQKGKKAWF